MTFQMTGIMRNTIPVTRTVAIVVLGSIVAGCGYALAGRGSFLPDYIQTIGIPMFENNTQAFEIEQLLTQEIRREFIGRGSYRVVAETDEVDAVLIGVIDSITISPASFTGDQQASRYIFTLSASIEFREISTDEVLWENPSLTFSDEYEVASGAGDNVNVSAFFGQRSNAVERIGQDFAETVVSSILEAF